MKMTITMPRGDIRPVNFNVKDDKGRTPDIDFDEIYFTVKSSFDRSSYLFQKRLSTGEIEQMQDGSYQFVIESYDTDRLKFGKYVFDIELCAGADLKQTFVGELILTDEATYVTNEGS